MITKRTKQHHAPRRTARSRKVGQSHRDLAVDAPNQARTDKRKIPVTWAGGAKLARTADLLLANNLLPGERSMPGMVMEQFRAARPTAPTGR
jgi:hypothetical protein